MNDFYKNVTILIKTFERPYHLNRLLDSLSAFYPEIKIIIVNDGKAPLHFDSANIKIFNLPYNLGIAYGRNFLADVAETDFVISLDDDFIVNEDSDFFSFYNLIKNSKFDIIGGTVICIDKGERHFEGIAEFLNSTILINRINFDVNLLVNKCDVIHNFFIAKTKSLKRIKWDNNLKNYEHLDFFLQAIGKINVGYCKNVCITHNQNPKYDNYMEHRLYTKPYIDYFFEKYNISELKLFEKQYYKNEK